jgi:hypothetical protein
MHSERIYPDLHTASGIDPKIFGRSPRCVYIQDPTLVGMDVPFVAAQHDRILSTIPVQYSPHQMEPKSVTVVTVMCLNTVNMFHGTIHDLSHKQVMYVGMTQHSQVRYWVQISIQWPSILTQDFCNSLKADFRIVPEIRP